MIGVDVGSGDRMALGVLAQYRMTTTEQMHRVIAPGVRIEQTRRRLARLREEGLVDRHHAAAGRTDAGVVSHRVRRRRYPLFPRILFVLDSTGPAGIENRISALRAGAGLLARFPYDVPVLTAPLADLLQHGPSAPVWRPVHDPGQRVSWTESGHRQT